MTPSTPAAPAGRTLTASVPQETVPPASHRTEHGAGRRDTYEARGLVRALVKPAAFFATNWAAMLGILTIAGIVPALAGATRTTGDLARYEDAAFTSTLRHIRDTVRRDAPASVLLVMVVVGGAVNAVVLPQLEASLRVFAVGLTVPVTWMLVAVLSAYVAVAAQDTTSDRSTVVVRSLALVMRRPLAALLAPALVLLLSPLWLLAPLTIACGFSVPPWVVGRLWGSRTRSPGEPG